MKTEKMCPKCKKRKLERDDSVRWYVCESYLKCGFAETQEDFEKREKADSDKKL